jgi:hypothetical protein
MRRVDLIFTLSSRNVQRRQFPRRVEVLRRGASSPRARLRPRLSTESRSQSAERDQWHQSQELLCIQQEEPQLADD